MNRTIAVLFITVLCACGVMPPPEDQASDKGADKWVGHTVDELVVAIGDPSNVYALEGGARVFEYLSNRAITGIHPPLSATARRNGAKRKATASGQSQDCKILFNVSASDIIESWSAKGEECNY